MSPILCRKPCVTVISLPVSGGEEFAMLVYIAISETSETIGQRIRRNIECRPLVAGDYEIPMTVSIGIFMSEDSVAMECENMLRLADEDLYMAKNSGRNQVVGLGKGLNGLGSRHASNVSKSLSFCSTDCVAVGLVARCYASSCVPCRKVKWLRFL